MTEIDVETGLPELPEGFYWQVAHPNMYNRSAEGLGAFYGFSWPDTKRLEVRLMEYVTVTRSRRVKRVFRKRSENITETQARCVISRECAGTAPIAVLNAANRVWKEYTKQQAVSALVGVYPPKRLEVSGDE